MLPGAEIHAEVIGCWLDAFLRRECDVHQEGMIGSFGVRFGMTCWIAFTFPYGK